MILSGMGRLSHDTEMMSSDEVEKIIINLDNQKENNKLKYENDLVKNQIITNVEQHKMLKRENEIRTSAEQIIS